MLSRILFFALFFATAVFSAPLNLTGTVKALNENGASVKDAVVLLKVNNNLIAYARTLSGSDGNFTLLPGKEAPGEVTPIAKPQAVLPAWFASYQAMDLKGKVCNSLDNLPQGIYVLLGKSENGKTYSLGTVYHKGGTLSPKQLAAPAASRPLTKTTTTAGEVQLIVRKAGFLEKEVQFSTFSENVGTVVLERDPLEDRIDSVMNLMTTADKIAQMTQAEANTGNTAAGPYGSNNCLFGSVLRGGDGHAPDHLKNLPSTLNTWAGNVKIPVVYGKDAVHGNAGIQGYTVFPHNIGLGASRDSALVRKIGEATAKEMWAAGINLNFSPAISVAQNPRWGRTYESYGETAELSVQMGAAMVRGLQGDKYNVPWRVISTAKHFLGDGGTENGVDRGDTKVSDDVLRTIHLPGYEAVIEQGVLSVMASFNQINGKHQHIDSLRMTGWLKTELGFDGYIISDWLGIANSTMPGFTEDYGCFFNCNNPSLTETAVRNAINAGIDLAMEPGFHTTFINHLTTLVNNNNVSIERINDAVRRILRAKFRAGIMDNISIAGPAEYLYKTSNRYSEEHKAIAREAVKKSIVLLKNDGVLPLDKNSAIHVFGSHRNDIGSQCGGWTISWRGVTGNSNFPNGTSIYRGMQLVAPSATLTESSGHTTTSANVVVHIVGEEPDAEWHGDINSLNFDPGTQSALASYKSAGKKIVTVLVAGRPRILPAAIVEASDAIVMAWLPGTEGGGVADVLFGDYSPSGKLPMTWPAGSGVSGYPYGFGLSY